MSNTDNSQSPIQIQSNPKVRRIAHKGEWQFSVVDTIEYLTESEKPANYWKVLKSRLKSEGSELVTKCNGLKLRAEDGKLRKTDCLNIEGLLRLVQSIPSPKAEPYKKWLSNVGAERIREELDPSLAIERATKTFSRMGKSRNWIKKRIDTVLDHHSITSTMALNGARDGDYPMVMDKINQGALGKTSKEAKRELGLKPSDPLRNHLCEDALTCISFGNKVTQQNIEKQADTKDNVSFDLASDIGQSATSELRAVFEKHLGRTLLSESKSPLIKLIK